MNDRDKNIKTLRPLLPTIIEENATSAAEQFQNQTLRPILKLQNNLLIDVFKKNILRRKVIFQKLSIPEQFNFIESCLRKDLNFRNLIVGCVVGHFTLEELKVYFEQESELRKRLVNMLVERVKSQMEQFKN